MKRENEACTCLSGAESPIGETVKEQAFERLLLNIQKSLGKEIGLVELIFIYYRAYDL